MKMFSHIFPRIFYFSYHPYEEKKISQKTKLIREEICIFILKVFSCIDKIVVLIVDFRNDSANPQTKRINFNRSLKTLFFSK